MFDQQIIHAISIYINTFGFDATRRAIEQQGPSLLAQAALSLLEYQLPRQEQSSYLFPVIEARLYALESCIRDGIDMTFQGYEQSAASILALLNVNNTWDEISAALRSKREQLLAQVADIAFADLMMQPSSAEEQLCILVAWNLVKMCRSLDIDEAINQYRVKDSKGSAEPIRALRIGQLADGRWSVSPEESKKKTARPRGWLSTLVPDSLGFIYLHSVHAGEEVDQYRLLGEELSRHHGLGASREVIAKHWEVLNSAKVREILAYLLLPRRYELPSAKQRVAKTRLQVVERCISDDVDAIFSGYEAATQAVLLLLNAENWVRVQAVVEENRHKLLPEVADIAFADLLAQPASEDEKSHVVGGWNLVKMCRELGVEAAFENQFQERRGTIISPESQTFNNLASAISVEEMDQALLELDLVHRRHQGQTESAKWGGLEDYATAMSSLSSREDLPERIETCRAALRKIDHSEMPLLFAMITLDLADGLYRQHEKQVAQDMSAVITLYKDALTILTAKGEPDQFGHAHHYLGDAYLLHSGGNVAENVEKAIKHFEKALGVRRRGVESLTWATTMAHLGEAFNRRIAGDRPVNLDRAIDTLEQAIMVLEESDQLVALGSAYLSLGTAFMERILGSRAENLARATELFNHVIEIADPSHPDQFQLIVLANGNLGALLWMQTHSQLLPSPILLEQAEYYFRQALGFAGPETSSIVKARLHMGLGLVLSDQMVGGVEPDEFVVQHLQMAIKLLAANKTASPSDLGQAYHNLANIYMDLGSGDTKANMKKAESHFLQALHIFSVTNYPVQRRDTLRALGEMCYQQEEWQEASIHFQEAIDISEEILSGCYTEPGQEAEVGKNRNLYSHAVFSLLKQKRFAEALETLEKGKARMLNEALGWKEMQVATLSLEKQEAWQWARDQLIQLEAKSRLSMQYPEARNQAHLGRQLADAYRHQAMLRDEVPNLPIRELNLAAIFAEIPANGALILPVVTPKGGAAFVLPHGLDLMSEAHIVTLDELTVSRLSELLVANAGDGGWLKIYGDWQQGAFRLSEGILQDELDQLTATLWEILMGPIHVRLQELGVPKKAPVVIIPSGWLGLFPLHAAFRISGGQRQTFGEDFTVSLAPSVRVLRICRQRLAQSQRQGDLFFAVANPTGDLQFAGIECRVLAEMFQEKVSGTAVILPESKASRANVVHGLHGSNYHHYSCHGQFHWRDPAASGLKLADGEWLHLADLLSAEVDLSTARLISLSACETGLSEFRTMPDEFISLPGAFLEGGAPAVVSTLWAVEEISTMLLMERFYAELVGGKIPADALQTAQHWLRGATANKLADHFAANLHQDQETAVEISAAWRRFATMPPDETPFAHPFYWAAFTLTGAWGSI